MTLNIIKGYENLVEGGLNVVEVSEQVNYNISALDKVYDYFNMGSPYYAENFVWLLRFDSYEVQAIRINRKTGELDKSMLFYTPNAINVWRTANGKTEDYGGDTFTVISVSDDELVLVQALKSFYGPGFKWGQRDRSPVNSRPAVIICKSDGTMTATGFNADIVDPRVIHGLPANKEYEACYGVVKHGDDIALVSMNYSSSERFYQKIVIDRYSNLISSSIHDLVYGAYTGGWINPGTLSVGSYLIMKYESGINMVNYTESTTVIDALTMNVVSSNPDHYDTRAKPEESTPSMYDFPKRNYNFKPPELSNEELLNIYGHMNVRMLTVGMSSETQTYTNLSILASDYSGNLTELLIPMTNFPGGTYNSNIYWVLAIDSDYNTYIFLYQYQVYTLSKFNRSGSKVWEKDLAELASEIGVRVETIFNVLMNGYVNTREGQYYVMFDSDNNLIIKTVRAPDQADNNKMIPPFIVISAQDGSYMSRLPTLTQFSYRITPSFILEHIDSDNNLEFFLYHHQYENNRYLSTLSRSRLSVSRIAYMHINSSSSGYSVSGFQALVDINGVISEYNYSPVEIKISDSKGVANIVINKPGYLEYKEEDILLNFDEKVLVIEDSGNYANQKTYYVSTIQDLKDVSKDSYGKYIQINDINLLGGNIDPILPSEYKPFMGDYDGGGFKIFNGNLVHNNTYSSRPGGLFGNMLNARIKNLTVSDSTLTSDGGYVGFLSGGFSHKIIDYYKASSEWHIPYVHNSKVENCTFNIPENRYNVGGMFGTVQLRELGQNSEVLAPYLENHVFFKDIKVKNLKVNTPNGINYVGGFAGELDTN